MAGPDSLYYTPEKFGLLLFIVSCLNTRATLSTVARREQAGGLGFYLALPMSQMPTPDQAPAPMRSVTVERERVKA